MLYTNSPSCIEGSTATNHHSLRALPIFQCYAPRGASVKFLILHIPVVPSSAHDPEHISMFVISSKSIHCGGVPNDETLRSMHSSHDETNRPLPHDVHSLL
mmetsp:Transcript_6716/g.18262  ORF Transcript_6716/g.18262 Transcript_6716/m.18262 type:complete len:101 (+) Transcript_6716:59-361(+)